LSYAKKTETERHRRIPREAVGVPPPVAPGDRNVPRIRLDPLDEGVLYLCNFASGKPSGSVHWNIKVPGFLICSIIETLDDRV
jgi:hypothetical protein